MIASGCTSVRSKAHGGHPDSAQGALGWACLLFSLGFWGASHLSGARPGPAHTGSRPADIPPDTASRMWTCVPKAVAVCF